MELKKLGQVYTPDHIVNIMLDLINYNSYENVIAKHIIDNSCGDGAFLTQIVKRYCDLFKQDKRLLKTHLETYIHGIEIDPKAYKECINSLNSICQSYNIFDVNWDIICEDALKVTKFNSLMDFVVGNPPYVRIHNLNDINIKNFKFSSKGMIDLYLAFYEISFNMLSTKGILCLITANSWLTSKAGKKLRDFIYSRKNLKSVIDFGHHQAFKNASTYVSIFCFINTIRFDSIQFCKYPSLDFKEIPFQDIYANGNFYFNENDIIRKINKTKIDQNALFLEVKNGLATLKDDFFINEEFKGFKLTLDILKVSTNKWKTAFFPYNKDGKPLSLKEIEKKEPKYSEYLKNNKESLQNRSITDKSKWYLYGRSQGLKDIYKNKIAINTVIRDINSIKLVEVQSGKAVYSGLYIISNFNLQDLEKVIKNQEFIDYISSLKKYKSGGYYTFSSNDLKNYLFFKLKPPQ